jgi:hypothetical protein
VLELRSGLDTEVRERCPSAQDDKPIRNFA